MSKKLMLIASILLLSGCYATNPLQRSYGMDNGIIINKEEKDSWGEYTCRTVTSGKASYREMFYNEYEKAYIMVVQNEQTKEKIKIYVEKFNYEYYSIGDNFNFYQGISTEQPYITRTTTEDEQRTQNKCK